MRSGRMCWHVDSAKKLTSHEPGFVCPAGVPCCAAGKYKCSGTVGSMECITCVAGKHSSSAGASFCTTCAAGKYSAASGAVACGACPGSKSALNAGSAACKSGSENTFTVRVNSDQKYTFNGDDGHCHIILYLPASRLDGKHDFNNWRHGR